MKRSRSIPLLCVVLALLLLGWLAASEAGRVKDLFVPRKLRTIEPGQIYASGQINRRLIRGVLGDLSIREIICLVQDDPSDPDVAAERAAAKEMGIKRLDFPLSGDGTGDIRNYAAAVAAMAAAQRKGWPVLLHCSSGAQRSNGATFYYRVLVEHWDADKAAAEMIRNFHDPRKNPNLIPYLNQHMGEMARLLVADGTIQRVPEPLPRISSHY